MDSSGESLFDFGNCLLSVVLIELFNMCSAVIVRAKIFVCFICGVCATFSKPKLFFSALIYFFSAQLTSKVTKVIVI